jgi:hypothetical protein
MGCDASTFPTVRQERMDTTLTRAAKNHTDTTYFIVNIHSMTNAPFIRDLIQSNGVIIPLFPPESTREQVRHAGVQLLHAQNDGKNKNKASAGKSTFASNLTPSLTFPFFI